MYFARRTLITLLLIGILLTSCGGENASSPTPDINAILTAGVGTLAAAIFQTQTALVPPATDTLTPTPTSTPTETASTLPTPLASPTQLILLNTPFATIIPSITPTGTQYTPTVPGTKLAYGCNNLALIQDDTIPAGTVLKPEEKFTKTWRVQNTGTCDWVYLYHLVLLSGDSMNGNPQNLGDVVVPTQWKKLSINLKAPKQPGTYTGYWRLSDQNGNMFGATLGVSIVVSAPTKTPNAPATAAAQTSVSAQQTTQAGTAAAAAQTAAAAAQTATSAAATATCQTATALGTPCP